MFTGVRRRHANPRPQQRDWWDKASIVSGFVSSVVIAAIGILISYSIQRAQLISSQRNSDAQIAIAKLKAQDDKKLQEGNLTAQLVQHLASKEAAQREIAFVALRSSVPSDVCDKISAILARNDTSPDVRVSAIEELGKSSTVGAARALGEIIHDAGRPALERRLAASSGIQVAVRQAAETPSLNGATLVLASTDSDGLALDAGTFTDALLEGMAGVADLNHDGRVSGSELGDYVATTVVPASTQGWRQEPIWVTKGTRDVTVGPLADLKHRSGATLAIAIGVSTSPSGPTLPAVRADVQRFVTAMQSAGISTTALIDGAATKEAVLSALAKASASLHAEDFFILYYAGIAATSPEGTVHWWLAGGSEETLTAAEINAAVDRIKAGDKVMFIDSCHAGAITR